MFKNSHSMINKQILPQEKKVSKSKIYEHI